MNILGVPRAIQKANQAKKQMQAIQALGQSGAVNILLNGINEIEEVEIDQSLLVQLGLSSDIAEKLARKLSDDIKKSYSSAKKDIEKKIVQNTSIDDLRELLG